MKHPIYYLPSADWFSDYLQDDKPELDFDEPYHKQTQRNHCLIDSPQGRLKLTVPVAGPLFNEDGVLLMKEIRISEHGDWRHKHWHAIETTYFNSPFFEYLQDDFRPIFFHPYTFLADLNIALIDKAMGQIMSSVGSIQKYKEHKALSASCPVSSKEYTQVFSHKHGFLPGLSIIDLIFNMGNESVLFL